MKIFFSVIFLNCDPKVFKKSESACFHLSFREILKSDGQELESKICIDLTNEFYFICGNFSKS